MQLINLKELSAAEEKVAQAQSTANKKKTQIRITLLKHEGTTGNRALDFAIVVGLKFKPDSGQVYLDLEEKLRQFPGEALIAMYDHEVVTVHRMIGGNDYGTETVCFLCRLSDNPKLDWNEKGELVLPIVQALQLGNKSWLSQERCLANRPTEYVNGVLVGDLFNEFNPDVRFNDWEVGNSAVERFFSAYYSGDTRPLLKAVGLTTVDDDGQQRMGV